MIKLAIDAMGSDAGSSIVIEPVKRFSKEHPVELYVYGKFEELKELTSQPNITVIPTTEVMEMTDGPLAVRRKKDSSMVRAMEDLKEGKVQGVVSSGGTGALLSCGMMLIKPLDKIERAAILTVLPNSSNTPTVLLDIGANAENTVEQLGDFAILGKAYAHSYLGIENPRISLLNIGSESEKGDDLHKKTYLNLKNDRRLNFIGNIEADKVLKGVTDVIVTDGFTGNVLLKSLEGTAGFLMKEIKNAFYSSFSAKLGALLSKKAIYGVKEIMDPQKYGGALIAGLNAPVVKAHGSSNEIAFYHAIEQLYSIVEHNVIGKVKEDLV